MNGRKVVFIAYQDQENLGVGYLSSMLLSKGFEVETVDFGESEDEIYRQLERADPLMVGFSLIFQYHFPRLQELARHLRVNEINCHFTVGGHYPSLRFEDVLNGVPEIDSVVRFEGELTVCELVERLSTGGDWREIEGIAYRRDGKPVSNELRPLISDLDALPFPLRSEKRTFKCMEKNCAFILASRGCVWNCAFCSIRKFYQTPPGRVRRSRSPANVVKEMKELYRQNEKSIFLFQDDDFFSPGKLGREWILAFTHELEREELADKILWKINCRPDEVDADLFRRLKEVGLRLVYLGIESGNPTGLQVLNKHLSVEDSIRAVKTLKESGILYDFGFMLFDPSSTFDSVRTNLTFLKRVCGDGSSSVVFCKMIPYAETDIERKLMSQGRLKGSVVNPDYDFLDPRLDRYYEFLHQTFYEWMFTHTGMLGKLRWHQFEVAVLEKFYPYAKGIPGYKDSLREIIASSNALFFHIAEEALTIFEGGDQESDSQLQGFVKLQSEELERINSKLREGMREFQQQQTDPDNVS
jgi:radical SAM superfamily enzyme YgiQ (UPF0313 family)